MLGCYVDGSVDRLPKNTAEYEDDIIAIPILCLNKEINFAF